MTDEHGRLLLDATATDLQKTVRQAVFETGDWTSRIEGAEAGRVDERLWEVLRDQLGVNALAVPEALGGAGAGWSEVAVVLGELGRGCAAVPYLGAAVTVPSVLSVPGADAVLESVATGSQQYALAVPATQTPWDHSSTVVVRDGVATGTVHTVADATLADHFLIPVDDAIYAVDAVAQGVTRQTLVSLDMTRPVSDLTFDSVPVTPVIESGGAEAVEAARNLTAALLASEQVGLAWTCLDQTVGYLQDRIQFGRKLGSYQALKHRVADLWVELTQASAVARHAAVRADVGGGAEFAVTAAHAHAYCSDVALRAAEEMLQLHGGIGFTWEHPTHLLLKRAKASQLFFGTPFAHRSRLAELLAVVDD